MIPDPAGKFPIRGARPRSHPSPAQNAAVWAHVMLPRHSARLRLSFRY